MSTTTALKVQATSSAPSSPAKGKGAGSKLLANDDISNGAVKSKMNPEEISSPHELTAYVENLLDSLESKFDEMSSHLLSKMNQMSSRVDALEASIHDIINGDFSSNPNTSVSSPTPGTPNTR